MLEAEARDFVSQRVSGAGMAKLERFVTLLVDEASRQNLIAKSTLPSIWSRHIADSAQLFDNVSRGTATIIDLGSGAGLPGVIGAILRPEIRMILVESRKLRIKWLEYVTNQLDCDNIVIEGRALSDVPTITADAIAARAFAPLDRLLQVAARFSTPDTEWVLPKGRSAAQEVAALPSNIRSMFHVKPSLTDEEAGIVVGKGQVSGHL